MSLLSETLPIPDSTKAISVAIENGDLAALQSVIGMADASSNTLMGGTPLMFASVMGQTEIVKWLLEVGCDINAQDENNQWTALMQAVFHGHYRVVEYLLSAGADPELGNEDGLNAHSIATMLNDEHLSEMLVKYCRVPQTSPGKKWWGKLTNKFSTIRALTAFKGKLKDHEQNAAKAKEEAARAAADGAQSSGEGEGDQVETGSVNGTDNLAYCPSDTVSHADVDTVSHTELSMQPVKENGTNSPDISPADQAQSQDTAESHENNAIPRDNDVISRDNDVIPCDTKQVLEVTPSHVIEVQPKYSEVVVEDTVDEIESPVLEDVVAEDLEIEPSEEAESVPIMNEVEADLISPDSGFVSRGPNSIPLDSQIPQSEYDGLDVDVPALPPDLVPILPDFDDWYPHNPQLTVPMVLAMGAPEDIVQELKQLNFLVET